MLEYSKKRPFQIIPESLGDAIKLSEIIANSDLAPKDYRGKSGNVLVAMQMGAEIGLSPMQSLQNIAVINGRPCVWGDATIGIARSNPACESIREWTEGTIKDGAAVAYCEVSRKGQAAHVVSFGIDDAKRAGLWNKPGTWQQYPMRMLQMRARGFAIRDVFPDSLKGLNVAEEIIDLPREDFKEVKSIQKKGVDGLKSRMPSVENKVKEEREGTECPLPSADMGNDEMITPGYIKNLINEAENLDDLAIAADWANQLKDEYKAEIRESYKNKFRTLIEKEQEK